MFQIGEGGLKKLLFDFGADPGDMVTIEYFGDEYVFQVEEVRTVNIKGVDRHALLVTPVSFGLTDWWIEGVGSGSTGLDAVSPSMLGITGNPFSYVSCELDSRTVCDHWDLYELNGRQRPSVIADVNGDDIVDIDDVNSVINHIVGHISRPIVYDDVNGDGYVDVGDLNLVINQMLGKNQ